MNLVSILKTIAFIEHDACLQAFKALIVEDLDGYNFYLTKTLQIQEQYIEVLGKQNFKKFDDKIESMLNEEKCSAYYIEQATNNRDFNILLDCTIKSLDITLGVINEIVIF